MKEMLDRPRRCDEGCWLAGLALVTACSWGRWLATGSLKVDENYPSAFLGTFLFVVLLAGYGLLVLGWRGLLEHPPARPRKLAFLGLGVAFLMLPMLSNDIFSLFAYGSLAAEGKDVYVAAGGLAQGAFYGWVGQRWSAEVCVYGPTTLVAAMPAALSGGNPWLALGILRLAWFAPLALVMELSLRSLRDRPFFHAMVWLNPLYLVEGPGQLHADLLGLLAVVLGVLLQRRGRVVTGWACFALAVLGKYTFVFTGAWFWLFGSWTLGQRLLRIPAMAAVIAVLGAIFYAPFWRGSATLLEPIRALAGMNPGGTLVEVVGEVVHVLRGGAIPRPDMPVLDAVSLQRSTHAGIWFFVSLVMRGVALAVGVRALRPMLRTSARESEQSEPSEQGDAVALGTGVIIVAVLTLASPRFQAWYLLAALPFFGLRCTEGWRRWWIAVVAVSVSMDFIHVLPRSTPLLPAWGVVTTTCLMVVFLMSFRRRYLDYAGDAR
jgi:hypothetical protein